MADERSGDFYLQHRAMPSGNSPVPFVVGIDLGTTNSLLAVAGLENPQMRLPGVGRDGNVEAAQTEFVPVQLLQLPQTNLNGIITEHTLFPSVVFQSDARGPRFVGIGAREAKFTQRRGHTVFYSVKLDLGIDREPFYPNAVTHDLDNPVKVSATILKAMKDSAEEKLHRSLDDIPVVITIPASFSPPQRLATLQAARAAGFHVSGDSLFDEPAAALLGYMNRRRIQQRWSPEETVLVFDFGGGTCDITVIDAAWLPSTGAIKLKMLAISRFEQLGGDDLDRHLVHTVLKDEFYRASGRKERDWGFGERQHRIWSQLAKIAELLKTRYCQELDKVAQATNWDETAMSKVVVTLPPQPIATSQGQIMLPELALNWTQFSELMSPFIDPKGRQDADKEYYRLTSIFTPIQDTLDKADLKPNAVTRILLAGGSSFNPLVEQAIQRFFPDATIDRPEFMDQLVAEGAAVHAYGRFVLGHDVLQPIVGDTIGLLTEGGGFELLIRAGAPIPFPPAGSSALYTHFRVPRENMSHVDLVICAGSAARPIHLVQLQFSRAVRIGSPVHLDVGLDGNKILTLRAFLPEYPDVAVTLHMENPLGLLPMTSTERRRRELENQLARAKTQGVLDQHVETMVELAGVLLNLHRSEQALQWLDTADRILGMATDASKRLRAWAHYQLGEYAEAYRIYRQFSEQNRADWSAAYMASICADDITGREEYMRRSVAAAPGKGLVHLGLSNILADQGKFEESLRSLQRAREALEAERNHSSNPGETLSLLATVYDAQGETAKAAQARQQAAAFRPAGNEFTTDNLVGVGYPITRS